MNIRKRLRRERRHLTRQTDRRFRELYTLQWMLWWFQMRELGITGKDIMVAAILQQALLDLHGMNRLVEPLNITLYAPRKNTTDEQVLAIAKKKRRQKRGGRNRLWRSTWTSTASTATLRRRQRYRGGRKARSAERRMQLANNGWRSALGIGSLIGAGALMYGLGVYGPKPMIGKVA